MKQRVQDILQLPSCKVIGLDTADLPVALLNLPPNHQLTVIPTPTNVKINVAKVHPLHTPLNTSSALASAGALAPAVNVFVNNPQGAQGHQAVSIGVYDHKEKDGVVSAPNYVALLRRIVDLTSALLSHDSQQMQADKSALEDLLRKAHSQIVLLQRQNQQLQQQGIVSNEPLPNATLGATAAGPLGSTGMGPNAADLHRQVMALQQERDDLLVELRALRKLQSTGSGFGNDFSGTSPFSPNASSRPRTGVSGAFDQGTLDGPAEAAEQRRLQAALADVMGGDSDAGFITGDGGVQSPDDLGIDGSWMDVEVRTQALMDACSAGRSEGKLELIAQLCKQQGLTREQVNDLLEGRAVATIKTNAAPVSEVFEDAVPEKNPPEQNSADTGNAEQAPNN